MQLFKAVFLFLCGCGVIDSIPTAFLWPWVVFRNEYEFRLRRFRSHSFFLYLLSFKKKKKQNACTKVCLALPCILQSNSAIICFKSSFQSFMICRRNCLKMIYFELCRMRWQAHTCAETFMYHHFHRSLTFFFQISNHAHSITFSGWIAFHTFKCALYLNSEISSGPEDAGLRLKLI